MTTTTDRPDDQTIEPMVRWPLVVNCDPSGIRDRVGRMISAAASLGSTAMPGRVLIIGCSSGLGLTTRAIAAAHRRQTVGVAHSRPPRASRAGSAGWYATEALMRSDPTRHHTVHGDAFSDATIDETVRAIADTIGQVDLVVYSVAAARASDPTSGTVLRSRIGPLATDLTTLDLDLTTLTVADVVVPACPPHAVEETVAVMGGADWRRWWQALGEAHVLTPDARTIAFSYQGGAIMDPIYRGGSLGVAKDHLEATAIEMSTSARPAHVVVTSAHVTPSSAVIPGAGLYWSLLADELRRRSRLEFPLHQMHRLFADEDPRVVDDRGRIRLDTAETDPVVQAALQRRWQSSTAGSPAPATARSYRSQLLQCNGFRTDGDPIESIDATDPIDAVDPIDPGTPVSTPSSIAPLSITPPSITPQEQM